MSQHDSDRVRVGLPLKIAQYLLAIALSAIATVLQRALAPYLPPAPHLFLYPAIVIAASIGGLGPGLVALACSTLSIAYFFTTPVHSLRVSLSTEAADLAIFVAASLGLVYLVARAQRAARLESVARQQAERASMAKDEVLAIVSHDLKNPLHTVALSADLIEALAEHKSLPRIADHALRIRRAVDRAGRLVGDLLDVNRIESGVMQLDVARCPADVLIEDALSSVQHTAAGRGIQLTAAGMENQWFYADRDRLLQVLTNVLGNSVRYIAPGGEVHVQFESTEGSVRIVVRDSGPGMTPEQVSHAFDRLWRGRRDATGSGLGLFISREIVKAQGGRIEIASDPSRGTTVTITLPQPKPRARRVERAEPIFTDDMAPDR